MISEIITASGYASHHVLNQSQSPEIERVVARRASCVKNTWRCMAKWLGLLSLLSVWLPTSGHTVTERHMW